MTDKPNTDTAAITYLPAACADNSKQQLHLDWRILVIGAALCSTVVWLGFIVWLAVRVSGFLLN